MRRGISYALVALTLTVILINLLLFLYSSSSSTNLPWYPPTKRNTKLSMNKPKNQPQNDLSSTSKRKTLKHQTSNYGALKDLMPKALQEVSYGLPVRVTAEEFRSGPEVKTGNPLIDTYGSNDPFWAGERGRGVTFTGRERAATAALEKEFNVNVMASDLIPLHRTVPDSRLVGCSNLTYEEKTMPRATMIIPFYDEWPSVLLRTVYSILNRTPRALLQEILLIDDHSTLEPLKDPLDNYIRDHFPQGLVRVLRMPTRQGLIRARSKGWEESKGEVVVFFDSHMEVNIDWLQPLLSEIQRDRRTVAMAALDYVNQNSLEYRFYQDYLIRYGFDWRLVFFETYFRQEQIGPTPTSPRPGTTMVGAAFAIDRNYFGELGGYDTGMKVWGGENLEMAWRVWMCGGRLVHVPCSHIGHIARSQPYSFPEGRQAVELFNYKRALLVWVDQPFRPFVFDNYPDMQELEVGDLSERYALKDRLQCRNFSWYLDTVWPELTAYNRGVTAWGSLVNQDSQKCLDNNSYLFQAPAPLHTFPCHHHFFTQGFSLTQGGRLRTTLQCVVVRERSAGQRPQLQDCLLAPQHHWTHTQEGHMVHVESQLCLDEDDSGPVMMTCSPLRPTQRWAFTRSP